MTFPCADVQMKLSRGTSSSRRSECREAAGLFVPSGRGCCHEYGGNREGYVGCQKRSESETWRRDETRLEAMVKASDEIEELDESDHAEPLKR